MLNSGTTNAAELLQSLLKSTSNLFAVLDPQFRCLAISEKNAQEFERIFGKKVQPGDSLKDLLAHAPEEQKRALAIWSRALSGESFTTIAEFGCPSLVRPTYELTFGPLFDSEGKLIGAYQNGRDITGEKEALQRLEQSEATFRSFFNSSPAMVGIVELLDDDILHVEDNPRSTQFFGLTPGETQGKRSSQMGAPREVIDRWRGYYLQSQRTGKAVRFEYWHEAVQPKQHHSVTVGYIGLGPTGNPRFSYILEDTTQQKTLEQELRQSYAELESRVQARTQELEAALKAEKQARAEADRKRALFQAVMDHAPVGIILASSPDVTITHVSRYAEKVTGKAQQELSNLEVDKHAETYDVYHADGVTRAGNEELPLTRATRNGELVENEIWTLKSQPSGKVIPVLCNAGPIYDCDHKLLGGVIIWRDISEQVEREKRLAETLLARDEFLSVASHELKTPIASLKLQTQLAKRIRDRGDSSVYSPERVDKLIDHTERQIERINRLVDDMLDIARIRSGKLTIQKEFTSFCNLVGEVLDRLGPNLKEAGTPVTFECTDENITGHMDRIRMEQVVTNLLTNAMRYGNKKAVQVKVERLSNGWDRALLTISDQGKGIHPEAKERIFNRFERAISADEVSGLGLGLFITRQIVEAHGGRIWVESPGVNQGSTFFVEVPLNSESAQVHVSSHSRDGADLLSGMQEQEHKKSTSEAKGRA